MSSLAPAEIQALARLLDELDYYQILEIPPEAPTSVVKKAYHSISRRFHPDANRSLEPEIRGALEQIARQGGRVDLLLTDVVLPGMSGRELAGALAPQHPHVRVLFATGYTDDPALHGPHADRELALLAKPFTREGLARKIREVLDGT